MNTPEDSLLGREVAYPSHYDANLLFPIPRAAARAEIGLDANALPFIGHDRWHAYELGWLDPRGKPQVATATVLVPADSPNLIESKSFKLYLNSLNGVRLDSHEAMRARIAADLSQAAGAPVEVDIGLPPLDGAGTGAASGADPGAGEATSQSLDTIDADFDHYGPPDAGLLQADAGAEVV